MEVQELLNRGIAAAKANQKGEARAFFERVIELDSQNEQAWLWLEALADSKAQRVWCLKHILAINPHSASAKRGLEALGEISAQPDASLRTEEAPKEIPQKSRLCTHCGHEFSDSDAAACPNCGQPLHAPVTVRDKAVQAQGTSPPSKNGISVGGTVYGLISGLIVSLLVYYYWQVYPNQFDLDGASAVQITQVYTVATFNLVAIIAMAVVAMLLRVSAKK